MRMRDLIITFCLLRNVYSFNSGGAKLSKCNDCVCSLSGGKPTARRGLNAPCGLPLRITISSASVFREASPHEFPFLTLLHDFANICAGSLITLQHVLTSQSCALMLTGSPRQVAELGLHDVQNKNQSIAVARFIRYNASTVPTADFNNLEHDIAVAELQHPAVVSSVARPACLPLAPRYDAHGATLNSVGWGSMGQFSITSRVPRVSSISYAAVKTSLLDHGDVCFTNQTKQLGGVACKGDFGAPLVVKLRSGHSYVLGVQKRHDLMSNLGTAICITDVFEHLSWIQEQVQGSCLCYVEKN